MNVFLRLLLTLLMSGCAARSGHTVLDSQAECLIPPSFDPGVGELYVCPHDKGERWLMHYARRSFHQEGLKEDIWIHFRGVFENRLWVNVGTREKNDGSLPAWDTIRDLIEQMKLIKHGQPEPLREFLRPIEAADPPTIEDEALKQRLLQFLRRSALKPAFSALSAVLVHIHLKPTREIEEATLTPITHYLSIPSHTDLLNAPRLRGLLPGSELKIAVAAGIWTYDWDRDKGERFVAERYDGPAHGPFALKFGHAYTRWAIAEYHLQKLNEPANVTATRVRRYIAANEEPRPHRRGIL